MATPVKNEKPTVSSGPVIRESSTESARHNGPRLGHHRIRVNDKPYMRPHKEDKTPKATHQEFKKLLKDTAIQTQTDSNEPTVSGTVPSRNKPEGCIRYAFVNGIIWRGFCNICKRSLEERTVQNITTRCGHTFHNDCLITLVEYNSENSQQTICPECDKCQTSEEIMEILEQEQPNSDP